MTRRAHPRSEPVAIHFLDRGCGIGIGAIHIVVARTGESGCRHDRRIHVLCLSRHERDLIAELAVLRAEQRVRNHLVVGGRSRIRVHDGSWVVHAGDHHRRPIAGRVGGIDFPGRVGQAIVGAPMVAIHAVDFVSGPILDTHWHVWRRELLTKSRGERIEFGSEVVRDYAGEVGGDVGRAEDVELRQRRCLVLQRDFPTVAQIARSSGKGCYFLGLREDAHEVRHDARLAHTGPELFDASRVAFTAGQVQRTQIRGLVLGVVGVVARADCGLVGQNIDRAKSAELLRDRRDVIVSDQDVLVLFLDQFITRRHNHFHHVLAGRQHGRANPPRVGRVGVRDADGAVRATGLARRVNTSDAGEPVRTVVRRWLELVPVVHAVIALELGIIRNRVERSAVVLVVVHVQVIRLVKHREVEEIGSGLARAVHVGRAIGPEALRPIVPTAGLGGVHQLEGWGHAIARNALLVEVNGHIGHVRRPAQVQVELWIVEWACGIVDHFAMDTAGLPYCEEFLAELKEGVLSGETLPTFGSNPRRINTSCGASRAARGKRSRGIGAVSIGAIVRAGHPQVSWQSDSSRFVRVRHHLANGGGSACGVAGCAAGRRAVCGPSGVVDDVGSGALVTSRVCFNHVPTE